MKRIGRRVVVWTLGTLARRVVRKYQPRVVAVTGSVGKTTTKQLIAATMASKFRLRASTAGYNTEFGVPLTILGQTTGSNLLNPFHWLKVIWQGFELLVRKQDYPEVLVLEMGADHPGDIRALTSIAPPDIAVITNVREVHLEKYPNVEAIAEEKGWLVRNLKPDGLAVLNFDDVKTRILRTYAADRAVYYGLTDESQVWVDKIQRSPAGLKATMHFRESEKAEARSWPFETQLLGNAQLYGVAAAFAVAYAVGISPEEALRAVSTFQPPAGRLTPLKGKDGLTIIDDTYNASPQATIDSLAVLRDLPGPHYAVLGNMAELGTSSDGAHRMVGEFLADWLDELVVVGDLAAGIADAALAKGLDAEKIHRLSVSEAAKAAELVAGFGTGSVLVKGSQSAYLERVVEPLLADPRDASRLVQRLKKKEHQANLAAQA
jgi:UDP-N-acetylmuramyl pentapeptide synthase